MQKVLSIQMHCFGTAYLCRHLQHFIKGYGTYSYINFVNLTVKVGGCIGTAKRNL